MNLFYLADPTCKFEGPTRSEEHSPPAIIIATGDIYGIYKALNSHEHSATNKGLNAYSDLSSRLHAPFRARRRTLNQVALSVPIVQIIPSTCWTQLYIQRLPMCQTMQSIQNRKRRLSRIVSLANKRLTILGMQIVQIPTLVPTHELTSSQSAQLFT